MPSAYSITDLERLTGIRAFTIRTWEKRYGLLEPGRTETNIRVYNDDDLRKILNVNTLLHDGWKISKISSLNEQDLEAEVWNSAKSDENLDQAYEIYMQALLSAALSFDEEWFESAFDESVARFGMTKVVEQIIMPFMFRVGLMWTVMRLHPGQEHFSSNLIRRKLLSAIDDLPKQGMGKKYVLFLPPWEEHEIGLIYGSYLLKARGFRVVYLGQRVPEEALLQTVNSVSPDVLLTFLTADQDAGIVQQWIDNIVIGCPDVIFCIASAKERLSQIKLPDNAVVLDSPDSFVQWLDRCEQD